MITGQEATDIGRAYLLKNYNIAQVKKATQENNNWILEFNVGMFQEKVMRLTINAEKGQVMKVEQVK